MDWLNLHTSVLDSPECLRCPPVLRATWIWLLRYCIGQENGGKILGCKAWGDSTWQQLCRIKLKEVRAESPLWQWVGDDLLVAFYPIEKQHQVQSMRSLGLTNTPAKVAAARVNGAKGGRPANNPTGNPRRTQEEPKKNPTDNPRITHGEPIEGKGIGREGKGREGDALPPPIPLDIMDEMDRDETPIELAKPIPMEINWQDWRLHHPDVFVASRRGDDGDPMGWETLFNFYGQECFDGAYTVLSRDKPKRIYYNQFVKWLHDNTKVPHASQA